MAAIPILLHLSILWTYTNSIQSSVNCCSLKLKRSRSHCARLSNYFCVTYGVLGYQDSQNFSSSVFHHSFMPSAQTQPARSIREFSIKEFSGELRRRRDSFLCVGGNFQLWNTFQIFQNLKNPDKKAIASTYQVAIPYLESWIESISYVRNICAHYGRLYNTKLTKKPKIYKEDQVLESFQ